MALSPSIAAELKRKITEAEALLSNLKGDLDKMEKAGIPADFQRREYDRAKAALDKLKAVYG